MQPQQSNQQAQPVPRRAPSPAPAPQPSPIGARGAATSGRSPLTKIVLGMVVVATLCFGALAAVKKVPYPEVKVTINEAYKPDPVFEKMRSAFTAAVAKKDVAALTELVAPTFLWTVNGQPADKMDLGRDAPYNFKVVFGFRTPGKDEDGGVENGPFWDTLAAFAADLTYYQANDTGDLVCGPIAAEVVDDKVYQQARKNVETGDEGADWYFTLAETSVAKAPGDAGAPLAKVGVVAMPLVSTYPPTPAPQVSHVEMLLPSGKSGWVPVASVLPLVADRLCYARTPSGEWKIALLDQAS
jgi:hypothetical protein